MKNKKGGINMEQKQMVLLFVVGILVGAVAIYGAAIAGYVPFMVDRGAADAAGLRGSPLGVNAQLQTEAHKILRTLEASYPGEKLAIARAPEIGINSDGEAFHIERLVVTRNGVFDKALTAEVLGMLNEKFSTEIFNGKLAIMENPIGGLMAVFGGKEEGAMALLGLQGKIFNPGSIEIFSDMAQDQIRAYAIFDEVKELRDSGVIQTGDEIVIYSFGGRKIALGIDGERFESMNTPIFAVVVYRRFVAFGENPINVEATEQLGSALRRNENFAGKCLVIPLTDQNQLFTAGMIHAGLKAPDLNTAILGIGAEFEAFEQLIGTQMPNSYPGGGSDGTQN